MNYKIKFGLAWITIVSFLALMIFPFVKGNPIMVFLPILELCVLEAIGIYILVKGLKPVIADKKTSQNGENIYGKIINIYGTGFVANDKAELKAEIKAYIPSYGTTRVFYELIGFNEKNYEVGQYLVLKYYKNDVNICMPINKSKIPTNVMEIIDNGTDKSDSDNATSFEESQTFNKEVSENNPYNNWKYTEKIGSTTQYVGDTNETINLLEQGVVYNSGKKYYVKNKEIDKIYEFKDLYGNKIRGIGFIALGIIWLIVVFTEARDILTETIIVKYIFVGIGIVFIIKGIVIFFKKQP